MFSYSVTLPDGTEKVFSTNKNAAMAFLNGKPGAKLSHTSYRKGGVEVVHQVAGSFKPEHDSCCCCMDCLKA